MAGYGKRSGLKPVIHRRKDKLAQLDPAAFETLIGQHYSQLGYSVERVGHGGCHFDGGIDLKLRRGDEYIVVQCKRENAYQVTHNVGHELLGVMCTQGATGAIVVNTGEFTDAARKSALGDGRLTLVDGNDVRRWFPELAAPSEVRKWEAVALDDAIDRRRARRRGDVGLKFGSALAVLAGLLVWQCSRPDPARYAGPRPVRVEPVARPLATPAMRPAPSANDQGRAPAETQNGIVREPSAEELAEWKRRNAESMEILSESTPEIELAPRR